MLLRFYLSKYLNIPTAVFAIIMVFSQNLMAQSAAEVSYRLFGDSCASLMARIHPPSSYLDEPCLSNSLSKSHLRALGSISQETAEKGYLGALAALRLESLKCVQSQLEFFDKTPVAKTQFVDDVTSKAILIGYEKRKMQVLLPAISTDEKAKEEYQAARLRAEAILASLPYTGTKAMRRSVHSIVSQTDLFDEKGIDDKVLQSFKETIGASLKIASREIDKDQKPLSVCAVSIGFQCSDVLRESLAQDAGLVESFWRQNPGLKWDLPIACRVEAQYGKGAQYRDNALLAASILGAGAIAGTAKMGAALASSVAGAGATGILTGRVAGILTVLTYAINGGVAVQQLRKDCLGPSLGRDHGKKVCSQDALKDLHEENCILSGALAVLGVKSVSKTAEVALEKIGAKAAIEKNISFLLSSDVLSAYPRLSQRIMLGHASADLQITKRSIQSVKEIPWEAYSGPFVPRAVTEKMSERASNLDPEIQNTMVGIFNRMHDKTEYKKYMETLSVDSVKEIRRRGIPKELELLEKGEVSDIAIMRVLVQRAKARGQGDMSTLVPTRAAEGAEVGKTRKPDTNEGFRSAIQQGPFFDKILRKSPHGMVSHLIQQDFVSDVVLKTTNGKPKKFWDFLGSKKGINFWVPLFDTSAPNTLSSPEQLMDISKSYFWLR